MPWQHGHRRSGDLTVPELCVPLASDARPIHWTRTECMEPNLGLRWTLGAGSIRRYTPRVWAWLRCRVLVFRQALESSEAIDVSYPPIRTALALAIWFKILPSGTPTKQSHLRKPSKLNDPIADANEYKFARFPASFIKLLSASVFTPQKNA